MVTKFAEAANLSSLTPCLMCLRPDKIFHFTIGLNVSPEGWWDCSSYHTDGGNGYKWMEIGWNVSTGENKHYFWVKVLTLDPPKLQLDRMWIQLVDHKTPNNWGYGPEHFIKVIKTVDDLLEFVSTHHILKDFFFTEKEISKLKLNHYIKR